MAALGSVLITRSLYFHGLRSLTSFSAAFALPSHLFLIFRSLATAPECTWTPHPTQLPVIQVVVLVRLCLLHTCFHSPALAWPSILPCFHNVSLSTGSTLPWSTPWVAFYPKVSNNGDCHFQDPEFSLPGVFPDPPDSLPWVQGVPLSTYYAVLKSPLTDLSPY